MSEVKAFPYAVVKSAHYETDLGNAERLIKRHGEGIHFVPERGKWFVWNGIHWGLIPLEKFIERQRKR